MLFAFLPFALTVALDAPLAAEPPAAPSQRLVVVTPGWDADAGRALLLEGERVVYGPVSVRVGRSGLGWGLGEHRVAPRPGDPVKREGDGRAPAGRFRVGVRWDRADADGVYCVDDVDSAHYTRIVRLAPGAEPAWTSAEAMTDYRVAIVIAHNAAAERAGGSCIFLHEGVDPTAGCTAFVPPELDALLELLRPGAELVQLPLPAYRALAAPWRLPALARLGLMPDDGPTDDSPTEDPTR